MNRLLTACEVADIIGCHKQTIYKWKDQGKIPHVKRNGLVRFRKNEIEEWIEQGTDHVDPITESLTKVDLILAAYDKMFLKGVTMSHEGKTWTYPFGSVYLRQNKTGKERWHIYYRVEGKRVRKVVKGAQSRSDALKVLQVEVADAFRGKHGFKKQEKRIKFTEFAELYLTNYAKVNKRSWVTDEYMLKKVKAFFKDKELQEIDSLFVEKFRTSLLEGKAKKSTTNRYLALVKTMFNLAIDWGYLKENPATKVKLFSEKDNLQERILTMEEEQKLFDVCPRYLKPIVLTALHAGMRKGEILHLKWEQVDFLNHEIKVENTKSGKPRFIPINDVLYKTLKNEKRLNGKSPFVFPNPRTKRPYVDVKKSFAEAVKDAGIASFRFHDTRHTFASRLVAAGVDLITVKELLGHHSVRVTERYTHANAEQKRNAVEGLAAKKPSPPVHNLSTKSKGVYANAMVSVN